MKHKIISANSATGSILVEYFTDSNVSLGSQNMDVPIVEGKYLTGPLLDHEIALRAPFSLEKRINEVSEVLNFGDIEALVIS